jgi:hypothetical protein
MAQVWRGVMPHAQVTSAAAPRRANLDGETCIPRYLRPPGSRARAFAKNFTFAADLSKIQVALRRVVSAVPLIVHWRAV